MNNSGIQPVGPRVLVLPVETERKTASGILLMDKTAMMEEMAQTQGYVISIGDTCWDDQPTLWAKEGDLVMFGKYSGVVYDGNDKQKYRILNDKDVVAVITIEEKADE